MSDDFGPALQQSQPTADYILSLAREAIARDASRELSSRTDGDASQTGIQRPGVTLDLGHKSIIHLPAEIIDIIKDEIERLAISHNAISQFPVRLDQCKRLRYLNARSNRFAEFPRPVLSLSTLEILDLSRNRLRVLPEEISEMKALKVFALQKNRLERLPTSIGDMHHLRVIKVDENPMVFPPPEVWKEDEELNTTGEKAMLRTTAKIKKYLRQHANSALARPKPQSETEDDSNDNAETPKPSRPAGTRFPVRPSLSGIDNLASSPDNETRVTPPPIPSKSHERIRSTTQTTHTISRKGSLLSPDSSLLDDSSVRSKRHGIVTPRGGLEAAALSPVALQEAFGNFTSGPHSRTGSNVSTASVTTHSILDTSKLIFHTASELSKKLSSMRPMLEWQSQIALKNQIESDIKIATSRLDALGRALRRAQREIGYSNSQRPSYLLRPVIDCLTSISQFARTMSQCAITFTRTSTHDNYKLIFWEIQKDTWDLYIANSKLHEAIRGGPHSRQTSISSQHTKQSSFTDRPNIAAALGHNRNMSSRSGFSASPNPTTYGLHQSNNSTSSYVFSPISTIGSTDGYHGTINDMCAVNSPQSVEHDALWSEILQFLKILGEKATDGIPKIQKHYFEQRQRAIRQLGYDQDHETVRQLGSLVQRSKSLVDVAQKFTAKVESIKPTDRAITQSLEFWELCRTLFLEWTAYVDKTRCLPAVSSSVHSEIKPVMKSIHLAIKDASGLLKDSPWGHFLDQSNYIQTQSYSQSQSQSQPQSQSQHSAYSQSQFQHQAYSQSQSQSQFQPRIVVPPSTIIPPTPTLTPVPSTPLSAALGPAAAATISKNGRITTTRSPMNVVERAEKLAAFVPRQQEPLYSKKA